MHHGWAFLIQWQATMMGSPSDTDAAGLDTTVREPLLQARNNLALLHCLHYFLLLCHPLDP